MILVLASMDLKLIEIMYCMEDWVAIISIENLNKGGVIICNAIFYNEPIDEEEYAIITGDDVHHIDSSDANDS